MRLRPPFAAALLGISLTLASGSAAALSFSFGQDGSIEGVLNTSMTYGAAWRMQERSEDLVGKANNDPSICDGRYQSCSPSGPCTTGRAIPLDCQLAPP